VKFLHLFLMFFFLSVGLAAAVGMIYVEDHYSTLKGVLWLWTLAGIVAGIATLAERYGK